MSIPPKRRNLWPFSSFSRSTVDQPKTGRKRTSSGVYKGHLIQSQGDGFVVPSIDPGSLFDTKREAQRFIRYWTKHSNPAKAKAWLLRLKEEFRKNPGKTGGFARCVKAVAARGGAYDPRAVCAAQERRAIGPKKLQALAAAGKKRAAAKKKPSHNPGRRNPDDAAAERYKFFHGQDPDRIIEVETPVHVHSVLSGIGKLVSITIAAIDGVHEVTLNGFKGTLLAQDSKGKQLYIEGGDQSVNLADFGIAKPHEHEILGTVLNIVYHTTKTHLRPEDGGKADYDHKFGTGRDGERRVKLTGRLPMASYDVRNKLIGIEGGTYTLPEVGIHG